MIKHPSRSVRFVLSAGLVLLAITLLLGVYRLVSGEPLGLRSFFTNQFNQFTNVFKVLGKSAAIQQDSQGNFTNIIFLHHSTGNNLVQQGKVRVLLQEAGYAFWDHGFNRQGLRGPDRQGLGFNYNVPGDNTDPDGLRNIFQQQLLPLPLNTFSALMQHEVIVLKSCFAPANNIRSDEQMQQYKEYYREIRSVMAAHPDRFFVVMTIPPLNPAETNPEEAARARAFSRWLLSDEFLAGQTNIRVFDFFDLLAESDPSAPDYNMLRAEYRDGDDSHPNITANEAIAPVFVAFLTENISQYRALASAK